MICVFVVSCFIYVCMYVHVYICIYMHTYMYECVYVYSEYIYSQLYCLLFKNYHII